MMFIWTAVIICIAASANSQLSPEVDKLMTDYWNWKMADIPQFATFVGIHDFDDRLDDLSLETFQNRNEKCKEFYNRAIALEDQLKTHDDVINIKEFKSEVMTYVDGYEFQGFLMPLSFSDGIHVDIPNLLGYMIFQSVKDYENLLSRYQSLPQQIQQTENLLREGVTKGLVAHNITMKGVADSLQTFVVAEAEDSPLWIPLQDMSAANLTIEQVEDIRSRARQIIIQEVSPSFDDLRNYVLNHYVTRPDIAVSSLPNGEAHYKALLRFHTSTDMSPVEIHQTGLDEVDRITKLMEKIIENLGYNMSVPEFSNMIRNDPKNYYDHPDDLLDGFKHLVYDVIIPKLPELFQNIPKAEIIVEGDDSPYGTGAFYLAGSYDGSRPGIFYVNVHNYDATPKYIMMPLSLHEGNPGHHLQGSHAIEDPSEPFYRRVNNDRDYCNAPSRFPMNTAYLEGWALYSESLGTELELYEDPLVNYGRYSMEIFRAARLVVDTGMHSLGWSREEAVAYMLENTASAEQDIQNEVDRYITWPGQATAYKIGQLKITELRTRAMEELGQDFDLKEFHDVMLRSNGPLDLMEEEVNLWIDQRTDI